MGANAGTIIADRYRLDERLGAGGMGEVWAATHVVTGRRYALKLLRAPDDRAHPWRADRWQRFLNEARAACAVEHPHIVRVHDVFALGDGAAAMVMELIEGETLGALIDRTAPMDTEAACNILVQLVSALGAAHEAGVVHRDVKPSNVLVATRADGPFLKVIDFGIAKLAPDVAAGMTTTGQLLGTPAYMAPEQCRGERDIDLRTDVWAIGVIAYELFSGARPLKGKSIAALVEELVTTGVPPLRALAPKVPFDIALTARRMLERDREERPSDLREVFATLARHASRTAPAFGAPRAAPAPAVAKASASEADTLAPARTTARTAPSAPRAILPWKLAVVGAGAIAIGYAAMTTAADAPRFPRAPAATPLAERAAPRRPGDGDEGPAPIAADPPGAPPRSSTSAGQRAAVAPPPVPSAGPSTAAAPVAPASSAAPPVPVADEEQGLIKDVPF